MRRLLLALPLLATAVRVEAQTPLPVASDLAPHRVTIASGTGEIISGYLHRPAGEAPRPAVVMLHGCSGMLDRHGALKSREMTWRDILREDGYVVLLLDSFTDRGIRSLCRVKSGERSVNPERERPHDAYGALRWLQAQPFVKPDRVALAGWSNGAMTLLWTIRAGAPQRPGDLAHDFRTAVGFYPGCIVIRRELPHYTAALPALLQVGLADEWTKPQPCIDFVAEANARGGARLEIDAYDGAYHAFDYPAMNVREVTISGGRKVPAGTHPEARATAIARVRAWLRTALSE